MDIIAIEEATAQESELIAGLVYDLLIELFEDEADLFPLDKMKKAANKLIHQDSMAWSFIAKIDGEIAGIINLNQCSAIYAGGNFGEITEMYVKPQFRSKAVGEKLILHAKDFSKEMGWDVIEVGAPDIPRYQRTVDFYLSNGFSNTGPRLTAYV
ncbi:GNAT family N-acetyltransferase [Dasania sp. GY-MA-18]|uniref:GNAT family N-acetyltransferase n=1 Tax=Dasania sp. GY-MA-18 TaxID=2966584 RepID=UPI0021AC986B|nr:GNAT family N-acetyltransferase [Dasania sp. GY-MA-18]MCR8924358.1 GNAT family N-acetyltransferase [Dasania sp. GY-MA-18]